MDEQLQHRLETPVARLLAFLANTRLDPETDFAAAVDNGRSLLIGYAAAMVTEQDITWNASQCADVVQFLGACVPMEGRCYCRDEEHTGPSLLCGYREVLNILECQLVEAAGNPGDAAPEGEP